MFQDRYMPDDQLSDEFELTRADRDPSPRHHSRKHEQTGKARHREDKPSQRASGRSQRASEELEDGEIEDGEVDAGAAGEAQLPAPAPGQERRSGAAAAAAGDSNGLTGRAPDVADGKHRYRDADGAGHSAPDGGGSRRASSPLSPRNGANGSSAQQQGSRHQRSNSSRPPSGLRSRSRSRSRSRPRSSSRDRSRRQRSNRGGDEQPGGPRSSGRGDRSREPTRDRSRQRDSSRGPAAGATAAGHERERERYRSADGSSRDRDRDRERYPSAPRDPGSRDNRDARDGRDARQRSSRDYDSNAPAGYRERQAARERDRGGRGDADRDRKRRSRSRSRDRGGEQRHKRSRDGDGERRRRRSSDDEPDLDIDPADLLAVDPLGLSAAEREAEEEARRLEESRKRRQAILAKHQQSAAAAAPTATAAAAAAAAGNASQQPQPPPQQQQQQQQQEEGEEGAAAAAGGRPPAAATPPVQDGTATPEGDRSSSEDSHNAPGSPVMDIWNRGEAAGAAGSGGEASRADEATSQLPVHLVVAGTEPNMQSERLRVPGGAAAGSDAAAPGSAAAAEPAAAEAGAAAAAAAADDMFADVDDDMFAAADEGAVGGAGGAGGRRAPAVPAGLTDNYDDAEGYYNFQVGEVLDGRYEVFACKGKGVFSTVLRARDKLRQVHPATGQLVPAGAAGPGAEFAEVAIKVIRSNETMAKAAALEQRILRLLSEKDPDNKKHVIRLLRTFEYRQHVCMVFEPMDMNLRELTLKYGRNVGLNITAVAIYAAQLLVALRHLQQCRVLHADIKPDNILVNARRSKVKICDLGSAMLAGENERTPYLVSRFYRSPEVILGLAYDFPMDMWSVGCVLYELFTGKILFPGRSNNEMLKLMMDVKGPFPKKMLKKGIFVEKHFEDDAQLSFALLEEDAVTKQPVRRVIPNPTAKHNFSQLLARAEGDRAQVAALADLLERMLALDPDKRIEADAALRHPFVKPWLPKKKAAGGAAVGGGG